MQDDYRNAFERAKAANTQEQEKKDKAEKEKTELTIEFSESLAKGILNVFKTYGVCKFSSKMDLSLEKRKVLYKYYDARYVRMSHPLYGRTYNIGREKSASRTDPCGFGFPEYWSYEIMKNTCEKLLNDELNPHGLKATVFIKEYESASEFSGKYAEIVISD